MTAGSQGLSSEGNEQNIALGAAAIDGRVIAPGEVFSFRHLPDCDFEVIVTHFVVVKPL